ncbi:MAG: amidohydrolase [Sporomusaceae bacterium]|nr:amidohydrolase [Sporomusaceae bacterium]
MQDIVTLARSLEAKTISRRRDFHKYAESGWTEFRTASIVAATLAKLGYEVLAGEAVIEPAAMMGVPAAAELERELQRALTQGAIANWTVRMAGGQTGVVGVLRSGRPGPTVALRFDMDAVDGIEDEKPSHRPWREGFASVNRGAMHACGHDGHTAIGLAVAEVLYSVRQRLAGTVKLIFQPAEEGVRGAKAMTAKGVVDDVDYLIGMHLGGALRKTGQIGCDNTQGFLATAKLDAHFSGVQAHAGAAPEQGKNAALAAAAAMLSLHAISRHSQGHSLVNVGVIEGGTGRNVIPAQALLKLETRGASSAINRYVYQAAREVIAGAAAMYGVQAEIRDVGAAEVLESSPELVERLKDFAVAGGLFSEVHRSVQNSGSEDCSFFMERVKQRGGQAAYIGIGTELAAGHHNGGFDINEAALTPAVAFLSGFTASLLTE